MYRTSKHRDILRWIIILVFTKSVGHGILFSAKLRPVNTADTAALFIAKISSSKTVVKGGGVI